MIDEPQQETQPLTRVYENMSDLNGELVSAESQFEQDSQRMVEEGWRLQRVSQQGTIVSPSAVFVATYSKA